VTEQLVLVAEDSVVVRSLLRTQLQERGYTVVEAGDGEEALVRARESLPDVVLLDVEMPRLDGFAVLAELKRDPRLSDVPVVFLTGRTSAEDAVRGLELGAHDYLRKPFEPAELTARVHAAARAKLLQDQLREANRELTRQALTDGLTGLPNRRFLGEELERLCSRSARHHRPLAVLMVDADALKAVNDRHGHPAGDRVLTLLGQRLAGRLRREDVVGRWSGEEFLLLAPDIEEDGARRLAEAVREVVAAAPFALPDGTQVALTVSVGVASWAGGGGAELLRRAGSAMQRAVQAGGDRVVTG